MVINTNLSAQSSATLLNHSSTMLSQSLARLSSGSKIISPADDSAGLAVSMKLNAQIARIDGASNNVGNAISFNQTQDGYLQKVADAFNRMSELAILSQDVTKSVSDKALYNQEFQTLSTYIADVATKDFNGVSLFDGTTLNVTTDSDAHTFTMTGVNLGAATYTTVAADSIDTTANAMTALTDVKAAINQLATRSRLHWLEHRKLVVLQRPARHVEEQPLRRQQPHHGCGRGARKHPLRQVQHPRPGRHGDVGPGERAAAVGAQAPAISG